MKNPILKMKDIVKEFPGVKALDGVNLELYEGKVMALMGENGAGKSTLMKILSGVYKKDGGQIFYKGEETDIKGPKDAGEKGNNLRQTSYYIITTITKKNLEQNNE